MATGGYGNLAVGRHQYGAPDSEVSPTFHSSSPLDGETNVAVNRWVEFYLHAFSSTLSPTEIVAGLEVDETGGGTYVSANAAPYQTTVRVYDGQKYWVKVLKAGPWRSRSSITFRVTCADEFGNACVKEVPVEWPA